MSTDIDETLRERLRELRVIQAPERDLWFGIEARIVAPRRRRKPWIAMAAAACLTAAVMVGVWQEQRPVMAPEGGSATAQPSAWPTGMNLAPPQRALVKANLGIVRDAEGQLRRALEQDPDSEALRNLLTAIKRQRRELDARLLHPARPQRI